MKYGILGSFNKLSQFPVTEREWRKASGVSMRKWVDCTDAELRPHSIVRVYEGSRPETSDRTQTARLDANPTLNGTRWEQKWIVTANGAEHDADIRSQIKREAGRRIETLVPGWKQRNILARSLELLRKGERNLTEGEMIEVRTIEKVWAEIQRIRTVSDTLEAMTPPPEDFADDRYWV
jgi:hypothetical protein